METDQPPAFAEPVVAAAIWKLSAVKEEYQIVPVNHIKHFKPASVHDFKKGNLYSYKPPNAPSSSYVFILYLGCSIPALKKKLANERVRYPNRQNFLFRSKEKPISTDDESQQQSQKVLLAQKKDSGKNANMEAILKQYKDSSRFPVTGKTDLKKLSSKVKGKRKIAAGKEADLTELQNDQPFDPCTVSQIPSSELEPYLISPASRNALIPTPVNNGSKITPASSQAGHKIISIPELLHPKDNQKQCKTASSKFPRVQNGATKNLSVSVQRKLSNDAPQEGTNSASGPNDGDLHLSNVSLISSSRLHDVPPESRNVLVSSENIQVKVVPSTLKAGHRTVSIPDPLNSNGIQHKSGNPPTENTGMNLQDALKELKELKEHVGKLHSSLDSVTEKCREECHAAAEERKKAQEERKALRKSQKKLQVLVQDFVEKQKQWEKKCAKAFKTHDGKDMDERGKSGPTSNIPAHAASVEDVNKQILVHLGKRVTGDNSYWVKAKSSTSKEDWVSYVLLSLFGLDAQFIRMRKPRNPDPELRVLPSVPPYLEVLKGHYEKWLISHPEVVDAEDLKLKKLEERRKKKKNRTEDLQTQGNENVVEGLLLSDEGEEVEGVESEEAAKVRRCAVISKLVAQLSELIGNKATDMYRQYHPRPNGKQSSKKRQCETYELSSNCEDENGSNSLKDSHTSFSSNDNVLFTSTPVKMTLNDSSSSEDEVMSPTSQRISNTFRKNLCAKRYAREGMNSSVSSVESDFQPDAASTEKTANVRVQQQEDSDTDFDL